MDERPVGESDRYMIYIDGRGDVMEGTRWQYYCHGCKDFWERQDQDEITAGSEEDSGARETDEQDGLTIEPSVGPQWQNASRSITTTQASPLSTEALEMELSETGASQETNVTAHRRTTRTRNTQPTISPRPPEMPEEELVNIDCKICFSQVASIVFSPCNHLMSCEWCAESLAPSRYLFTKQYGCPVCRTTIKRKIAVYRGL
ncbi:uncharacterized protein V1510DRAFT_420191 [Dipodascopsis tothii]|uniref:uncharacterized protein n=1 Tax=Dipodascopsis tothii TaxID=44089 RepID=UPI0034CDB370